MTGEGSEGVRPYGDLSDRQRGEIAPFPIVESQQKNGRAIGLLYSVCYAKGGAEVARLIARIAPECESLLIVDQIENYGGQHEKVMDLKDADGRPYQATCHPFARLLTKHGFAHHVAIPAPYPTKSLSGIVLASRTKAIRADELSARAPIAPAVVAEGGGNLAAAVPIVPYRERVARLQRSGNDEYLWTYWNANKAERFVRMAALCRGWAQESGSQPFRALDFGCSSGAFFRALRDELASQAALELTGVDVDSRALRFMRDQLPDIRTIEADAVRFRRAGIADTARFDVCVSAAVLLLLSPDEVASFLEDAARMAPAIVIADQIENAEGATSEVRHLTSHTGYEYDAVCHPFAAMLRRAGFNEVSLEPLTEHVKGATGIISARRTAAPAQRAEYQAYESRVARLQRDGDDSYLQIYWDAYALPRFNEFCAAALVLLDGLPAGPEDRKIASVFDFAPSAGPLFRALNSRLGHRFDFQFAAADADKRAVAFLRHQFRNALIFESDPQRLRELQFSNGERFDLCSATSLCYALDDASVRALLAELAAMSDLIVIGDQIENADGERAETMQLTNADGALYDVYCHPFRTILRSLGFKHVEIVPGRQPVKSATGLIVASRAAPLPPGLRDEVLRRADYEYFGTLTGRPAIAVHGARALSDAVDDQFEELPPDIAIEDGAIHRGPELIDNVGIKLSAPIPPQGSVWFEVDAGAKIATTAEQSWSRPPSEMGSDDLSAAESFPRGKTPPGERWQKHQWGSWVDLAVRDGLLAASLTGETDIDVNQADGMGPLDLLFYVHPDADLRDASVDIEIRGRDFVAGDAEILLWFQNRVSTDEFNRQFGTNAHGIGVISANYALTSSPLTPYLTDGEWHKLTLQLRNDPGCWSFAGNVFADRENAVRYAYMSLDQALSAALYVHILACYPKAVPNFLDKRDATRFGRRPRGVIEMRRCKIVNGHDANAARFGNVDYYPDGGVREGRYRVVSQHADGTRHEGEWLPFALPDSRRPVVSRLTADPDSRVVAGRVNAMGYRTWIYVEDSDWRSPSLYLGATKHSRDFRLPVDRLSTNSAVVMANECGGLRFRVSALVSS